MYRFGNPVTYDAGATVSYSQEGTSSSTGDQQFFFTHDVHWLNFDLGLGADNTILIFDNGARRPNAAYSVLMEINPYIADAQGTISDSFVMQMAAGKKNNGRSNQVVWEFKSNTPQSFYSSFISGLQRLPNGNTLACSGASGHFFELAPDKSLVWEYVNPCFTGLGVVKQYIDQDRKNIVFRCYRYGKDFNGFAGKTLRPMGTVVDYLGEDGIEAKLELSKFLGSK